MCLTDAPVPDDLHAMLDECATDEVTRLMAPLPRMRAVEGFPHDGLRRCLRTMPHPDAPDPGEPWF
jgi:hypothetical protein